MPSIEIFRTGTHTPTEGAALAMTAGNLAAIAAAYDPKLHEAPVVVGHPKADAPSYGWVKGLKVDGDRLVADLGQVDAAFADLVKAGRFKKVSSSFYLPDAPNNPKPGQMYLRHVGFLGAAAPAVKGLKAVAFADGEAGVADFTDWNDKTVVRLLRGLRDLLVEKFGLETADKVLPATDLNWLQEDVAVAAAEDAKATPSFTEPPKETGVKTAEEIAAEAAQLAKDREQLAKDQADFAERERAARAATVDRESADFVDGLVKEGRFLPANRANTLVVMGALAVAEGTVAFAEGDKTLELSPLDAFKRVLAATPKIVDLGEAAGEHGAADFADNPTLIANAASDHVLAEAAKGRTVSAAEAVAHVTKGARR